MGTLLECKDLTKSFSGKTAIDHIDLSIESGHIIGLLGPNGSGKTTLIKMINGLLTPHLRHPLLQRKSDRCREQTPHFLSAGS